MWAQAHVGDERDSRPHETFSFGGFTFTPNLQTSSSWRGFQMGGDEMTSNNWHYGFTAGYLEEDTHFKAGPDHLDLSGWNAGAYGGFNSGMFFVNGLIKGDWFSAQANMISVPAIKTFDGDTWGVKAETGFRFGSPHLYVEPLADVAWNSTHVDKAAFAAQATTFSFPDASQSRGEIGARLGGQMGQIMPYVGVYAVDVFSQDNKFHMITGACPGACMELTDVKPGDYAKTDFGFTIVSWAGLEGFLKGEALFGDHTEGLAGRLGVRWHW
jgi:outer membrane autotransporter protein